MNLRRRLQEAVTKLHGGSARWIEEVAVAETFQGKPTWTGFVQVYALERHPTAPRAYAWKRRPTPARSASTP
jgi:hypothetical protein